MMNSRVLTNILLFTALSVTCTTASAGLKQMGVDYRTMLSNYAMLRDIGQRCPDTEMPEVVNKRVAERMMQEKMGIELFIKVMVKIQKSDLTTKAHATIDKLFTQIEGCEDPRLQGALGRIASVHSDAYERLKAEPALVKPENVPIPMRRN